MFKKTLAAVAVLGAFAGAASAASVTLYGLVDEAFDYSYVKQGDQASQQTYGLKSGVSAASRFGVKGMEELGNGYTVGFQLENGFKSDTGAMSTSNTLFDRVSSLYVTGPFGTLAAGRDGALDSGVGTVSYIYQYAAFGTGWAGVSSAGLLNFGYADRANNTLTYITPDLNGLKVYAQYSFAADDQEKDHETDNSRYAALGAQYKAGAFSTGIVVDQLMPKEVNGIDNDDQFKVSYGASYDFGVAKVMGLAQYTKHMSAVSKNTDLLGKGNYLFKGDLTGWNLELGTTAPVLGGTAYAQVNYLDVKDDDDSAKFNGYGIGLGYAYPLSKRTTVYTYAGWNQFKDKDADVKTKIGEAGLGLSHKF